MALPTRGQPDWDDELGNHISSLEADVQSAKANAEAAISNANEARNVAQAVRDVAVAPTDQVTATLIGEETSATNAAVGSVVAQANATQVPALVAEAIAANDTPALAAAAAVDSALADSDLARRNPAASRSVWGHSIAKGTTGGATPWSSLLATALGVTIANYGENGYRSDQIAARQGGAPVLMSTTGGVIPESGAVSVTLPFDIIPSGSLLGRWGGVPGTFTRTSTGTGTFTRTSFGSAVSIPLGAPFISDVATTSRNHIIYLWPARNDPTIINEADSVINVARMLAYLTPTEKRVLILEELPTASDTPGTTARDRLDRYNTAIRNAFPQHWVPIGQWLRTAEAAAAAGITFTAQDNTDIANSVTPTSFRVDSLHLNTAGNTAVAWRLRQEEVKRGWVFTDAAAVVPYASDTFNRADGAMGSTEVGALAWAVSNGSGSIVGNRLALVGVGSQSGEAYVTDPNLDGELIATLVSGDNNRGLVWRASSGTNGYVAYRDGSNYVIKRRTALAGFTTLASSTGITPAAGDVLRVRVEGSTHKLYVNGVLAITVTDSTYATGTRKGCWWYSGAGVTSLWDDFTWAPLV